MIETSKEVSQWNQDGTYWEEKSQNAWAKDKLLKIFQQMQINLGETAIAKTLDVHVEGDAVTEFRKGKKYCIFDLKVRCGWSAVNRNKNGVVVEEAKGGLRVENFTSEDDPDEWSIDVTYDNSTEAYAKDLNV
eukprot:GHVR01062449.1.p1 GENE.GHVR01062449.1~~GHVR01062449.1.p1  ORF type:complete len:144 (+),score=28.28 GHVR01062449.1:36-434(+)